MGLLFVLKGIEQFFSSYNFSNSYTKVITDNNHIAIGEELTVNHYLRRRTGLFIKFDNRTLTEIKDIFNFLFCTAYYH